MRLQKLELQGFKSFAKRVEVCFDEGVTAIVGPNGSGKSNIADAIRWVLGEQSARALRGGKMEDVIFNGAEGQRAQAYCEVTLTFDNHDGKLPVDFQEVAVMRRVYRSGESEYFINRSACRLRDIVELFRDTGIGKEGYSIIGQGRVDEILSGKSEDRRSVFEEAAGISKYKARKIEAEKKLDKTRENLVRIGDIVAEMEERLEPLARQSETARKYLKWRGELRDIDLNVFLHEYERMHSDDQQQAELLGQLGEEAAALQSEQQTQQNRQDALEADWARSEEEGQERNRALIDMTTTLERADGERKLIEQRYQSEEEKKERLDAAVEKAREECEQIDRAMQSGGDAAEGKQGELDDLQARIQQETDALQQQGEALEREEQQLDEQKNALIAAINQRANARVQQTRLEGMRDSLVERCQAAENEKIRREAEFQDMQTEQQTETAMFAQLEAHSGEIEAQGKEKRQAIETLRGEQERMEGQLQTIERQCRDGETRLRVLQEMSRDYEGYYSSVKRLLQDVRRDASLGRGVIGVVAERVQVPEALEGAIEMTLGSSLQHVICEDEQDARRAIEYLRQKRYGRVTFLPRSSIRSRRLQADERKTLERPGVLGIASELVRYEECDREIVENLLGRTVIVDSLETGIALARANRQSFRIASVQGDLINPGGSMTGGSRQKSEFSLLGRGREADELAQRLIEQKKSIEQLTSELAQIEERMRAQKQQRAQIEDEWKQAQVDIARQHEKCATLERLIAAQRETLAESQAAWEQASDMLADIERQSQEAQTGYAMSADEEQRMQEEIAARQRDIAQRRQNREKAVDEHNARKMEWQSLEGKIHREREEQERLSERKERLRAQMRSDAEAAERAHAEMLACQRQLSEIIEQIADRQQQRVQVDEEHDTWQQRRRELEEQRKVCGRALEALRERARENEQRQTRVQMRRQKIELERDALQTRIWNDYELTYQGALAYRKDAPIKDAQRELNQLRSNIRNLGEVNVNAVEDYENLKTRFEEMNKQKEDLQRADTDLTSLINDLLTVMSTLFREQFNRINRNFQQTFEKLFGGGRAELRMTDDKDVLNSDIEIIAQPPGKNLQLLSLLSGGERALTAIALLFSMLQLKPTPFCILDEIEASLDEANVDHFAHYVKSYSKETQFILITHRKGSMAVSDSLYGVAMEGKGISKLVSVRLREAEKLLEG